MALEYRDCRSRAATSVAKFGACAQSSDPATKTTIASEKIRRAPKRSAITPLAGMNTARLRRYEVKAMLRCEGDT